MQANNLPPYSSGFKKLKSYGANNVNDGRDIISSLHDSVLHQILGCLDMKYVVQTSILSRRWRNLWKSLPYLDFKHMLFYAPTVIQDESKNGFMDFVEWVLHHRDGAKICTFRISCGWYCDALRVSNWILVAIHHGLEELCLNISLTQTLELPQCLFTCISLRVLKLETDRKQLTLRIPDKITLPRLKTLHLIKVFMDEKWTEKLFSSCPVLENLIIENCQLKHIKILNISSLQLKELAIKPSGRHGGLDDCKVEISAPNLRSFSCSDCITRDYSVETISALVKAEVDLSIEEEYEIEELELIDERKKEYAQRMIRCINGLKNAKALTLSACFLEILSEVPKALYHLATPFSNLNRLKLETWLYRDCIRAITYLLQNSPNIYLLMLEITEKNCLSYQSYRYWDEAMFDSVIEGEDWVEELPFQCTLHHLKFVEIQHLLGCTNELKFLQFLLKNATVLQEMRIVTSKKHSNRTKERLEKLKEKLQTFPRASPDVKIIFS